MNIDKKLTYQEIDFLLPAQRFNIQFSFVTKKGFPFIREFVLRLVHIAPMTKSQIASYFGLSRLEVDEAVSDLVQRGELTLSEHARLTLTDLSQGYFTDLGETPQLSAILDSGASLSFDLATFCCFGKQNVSDSWKVGIPLSVDNSNTSQSEKLVEKHFQHQFNEILEKGFLPDSVKQDSEERPYVYTVNAVNKLRDFPLRLPTKFKVGMDGTAVERDDFENINNSEAVHSLVAMQLSDRQLPANTLAIMKTIVETGDAETIKAFDLKKNSISPQYIDDLQKLEEHSGSARQSFIGQVYEKDNWERLQSALAPTLEKLSKSKSDSSSKPFVWIAPSDPYWGKSESVKSALSDFVSRSSTKKKKLYTPILFVPVSGPEDTHSARGWIYELNGYEKSIKGLYEGMLDGHVEILHMERTLVAVVYHCWQPETLPVTMPIGYISTDKKVVDKIGRIARAYIDGNSAFDKPNDCGFISSIAGN